MPDNQTVKGPDGQLYQFPQGTTKEQAISYFKKKGITGVSKEITPPDAAKSAHEKMQQTPMERSFFGGSPSSIKEKEYIDKHMPLVPGAASDIRQTALTLGGGSMGPKVAEELLGGAPKALAGGSKLLQWLFPALARATGAGAGAMTGSLVAGGKPGESLKTGAEFGTMEFGGDLAVAGGAKVASKVAGKVGPVIKEALKSPVTKMEEKHAAEAAAAEKAFAEKEAAVEAQHQKELTAHREKVQGIKAEFEQQKSSFKSAEDMKAHQQKLAGTVRENLEIAEKRTGKKIGEQFEKVGEAVEKKVKNVQVTDSIKEAKSKLYFPNSMQAFDNIMENFKSKLGMTDFAVLRKTYTEMNNVLDSEMDDDLYKAVKVVRDNLGKDLQKAATQAGMGERFAQAMKNWRDFKNDWHNPSSVAKGGSVLRKILESEDPQFVIDNLSGKGGERAIETLKKYGKYGADSGLAKRLRDLTEKMKSMPKAKAPETPRIPAAPERPAPGKRPDATPFDRQKATQQMQADRLRRMLLSGAAGGGGIALYELGKRFFGGNSPTTHVP